MSVATMGNAAEFPGGRPNQSSSGTSTRVLNAPAASTVAITVPNIPARLTARPDLAARGVADVRERHDVAAHRVKHCRSATSVGAA
jgi:hypothetical protein